MFPSTTLIIRGAHSLATGILTAALLAIPGIGHAAAGDGSAGLADLSLEELLNMEITTLSRKAEDLADAPAAVFVISQNDIARSGARSIPDLLRMVPGMQVAQIDSNKWAVTARGANGRFANKLLVLMDGRSVYSPLLSGVYWDVQDTDLSSIERIEVIRGPGATMWGSNAVNGVVNIISKKAADTQGAALSVMASDPSGGEVVVRYGGQSEDLAYRLYAKAFDYDGNIDTLGMPAGDDYDAVRLGGRADWANNERVSASLTGEYYVGESGEMSIVRDIVPPYESISQATSDVEGGFLQYKWTRQSDNGGSLQVLSYLVHEERDSYSLSEKRDTADLDVQYRIGGLDKHDVMWGLALRYTRDDLVGSTEIDITPNSASQRIFSAFIQDDIQITERLRLILGSKFESNSFSSQAVEIEPSIRASYRINDYHSVWASVSRAVRTPSRGELDGMVVNAVIPPTAPPFSLPVPILVTLRGNRDFASEEIVAYEMGFRFRTDRLFVDLAMFYNDYDELRSVSHGDTICQPSGDLITVNPACLATSPYVETPFNLENGYFSESVGAELWVSREMNDWWKLQAGYTYYHSIEPNDSNPLLLTFAEDSPEHQASVRSSMDLGSDLHMDLWLRYVDELEKQQMDSYTALDARISWSPRDTFELSAVGRNLIAGRHIEFVSELGDLVPIQIEPQAYIEFRWTF